MSKQKEAIEQIQKQIKNVSDAMVMLEGRMNQPLSTKTKVKRFFIGLLPMRKKEKYEIQNDMEQLSYSILAVQKQFLTFVCAVNQQEENGKVTEMESGFGMYE